MTVIAEGSMVISETTWGGRGEPGTAGPGLAGVRPGREVSGSGKILLSRGSA